MTNNQQKTAGRGQSIVGDNAAATERHSPLARLRERAAEAGWRCLADTWFGDKAKYAFECARGHRFERNAMAFLYRNQFRCAECEADEIKRRWLATVETRGGTLVEGTFTGLLDRYRLRCAKGHEWETQGRKISEGRWCHQCARDESAQRQLKSDGLQRLKTAATEKGGRCLSESYSGGRTYYQFECAQGHHWEAAGSEIVRGVWCLRCAQIASGPRAAQTHFYEDGLERLQEAARNKGGECLSTAYTGSHDRYKFRCARGHEWSQAAAQIWLGHWCGRCVKMDQRTSIEALQALAASRGGRCLSAQTAGKGVKLTWECHLGHVWQTTPSVIKQGAWCPNCANLNRSKKWRSRVRHDVGG